MGNMTTGQIVGSVIGFVIGYFTPIGAVLGMAIGGMIGGYIDPPPAPDAPPLGNFGVNSFVHNAPVPLIYGQNKVHGGCIWLGNIETGMNKKGGKKSPEYSPWMKVTYAIGHCEGLCIEAKKYWLNDHEATELITTIDFKGTYDLVAGDGMHFNVDTYLGADNVIDQPIDPRIEYFLEGSTAPGIPFLHTCYSVIKAYYDGGYYSAVPTTAAELVGPLTETGEEDANTVRVIYDFFKSAKGLEWDLTEINGDPDTPGTSWYEAAQYCDELVSYYNESNLIVWEPRFRYSNVFDRNIKGYDLLRDLLYSCRGILTWNQGLIDIKIENADEEVVGHFSDEYIETFTTAAGSTTSQINISTTFDEVAGFWEGAYASFEYDDVDYEVCILEQGTDYVILCDAMDFALAAGIEIEFKKDNIKESTFVYNSVADSDTSNRVRVEFINRQFQEYDENGNPVLKNAYQWDVVEWDGPSIYNVQNNQKPVSTIKEKQIRIEGVKRKSQAIRTAKYFVDFSENNRWYCEFVTDIVGHFHSVGDIITVTHSINGWEFKEFRIINIEELDMDELKIQCFEYNRDIYDDFIGQVIPTNLYEAANPLSMPKTPERFNAVQGSPAEGNKIFICYKVPDNSSYYAGVRIYRRELNESMVPLNEGWVYVKQVGVATSSVKLIASIDNSQTTIAFDSTTLYGTFLDEPGHFWIEDELISYTGIDSGTNSFTGCVRGVNGAAVAHDVAEYIHYKTDDTPYIMYDDYDVGQIWELWIRGFTTYGAVSSDGSGGDPMARDIVTIS